MLKVTLMTFGVMISGWMMKPLKRLVIMQGKPGCGKSWIAKAMMHRADQENFQWEDGVVSADAFLRDEEGKYVWTPVKCAEAHQMALKHAEQLMLDGMLFIVIDNTNLKYEWARPYLVLADIYNYAIQVVRVDAECELQEMQNESRGNGQVVPSEKFGNTVMEDILSKLCGQSFSQRLRVLWYSLRAVFS